MGVSVESHVYMALNIGGKQVPFITDAVVNMWIVTLIIISLVVLFTRKITPLPSGRQKWAEALVDFVNGLISPIGEHAKVFAPFICTLLLFLAVSNTVGIFNIIPSGAFLARFIDSPALEHFELEIAPPTRNFNVTVCLALVTVFMVFLAEFRYKGFRGWLRSFWYPSLVSAFTKILDYIVRPLSLCLRLFGNILGAYISMALLYGALPLVLPAFISLYMDLFDGLLQAYIFIFLTIIYFSEAVEPAGPEAHEQTA